ncbi:MAG: hypothetical protein AAF968_13730 [Pseudomonadota bacterium]
MADRLPQSGHVEAPDIDEVVRKVGHPEVNVVALTEPYDQADDVVCAIDAGLWRRLKWASPPCSGPLPRSGIGPFKSPLDHLIRE